MNKIFVAGGAGFIGSHLTERLLNDPDNHVTVYDNFTSGKEWHLSKFQDHPNLSIIHADLKDLETLTTALHNHECVYLFASNPDIGKAITQPNIDFWEGTYITQNVLEAMRINQVKKIIFASGSGVYGDAGLLEVAEDYSPMLPISSYGASKLASEALICSYCHMFNFVGRAYRFANVVGPNQTHGVVFDFIHRLRNDPTQLSILGDGNQSKSYIYIDDILDAIFLSDRLANKPFDFFNVATGDYITVNEIATIVVEEMGLKNVGLHYSGGNRGWTGDVPIVRLNIDKIKKMGWSSKFTSNQAIKKSIIAMIQQKEIS